MDLKCSICLELFKDPQEVSCCHNIFCRACLAGVSSCPMCRSPLDATKFKPNIPIARMANELRTSGKESLLDDSSDIRFLAETNSLVQSGYAPTYVTGTLSIQAPQHSCMYCGAIATSKCHACSNLICVQHSSQVDDGISKYSKERTFCYKCGAEQAETNCSGRCCLWIFAILIIIACVVVYAVKYSVR